MATRGGRKASSTSALTRQRHRLTGPIVEEEATQRRLQELLLNKNAVSEDVFDDAPEVGRTLAGASRCGSKGGASGASGTAGLSGAGGGYSAAASATAALSEKKPPPSQQQQLLDIEDERREFVEKVCTDGTRHDVQNWVGKIFTKMHISRLVEQEAQAAERRRRRGRQKSGSATSDAGLSGLSGNTGQTGETGQSGTTGTALFTAGGSIAGGSVASPSYRGGLGALAGVAGAGARSVASEESLVVHHQGAEEPLSVKERVQAYLGRRIPELEAHVNDFVAKRTGALQREVDDQLADEFLLQTAQRKVFGAQANYLRWQNTRHNVLQKRLNADMSTWILEAIQGWDQKTAEQKPDKDLNDTDVVFDYLTKRAANIDIGKLPSEIPIFKTLHASYSMPAVSAHSRRY